MIITETVVTLIGVMFDHVTDWAPGSSPIRHAVLGCFKIYKTPVSKTSRKITFVSDKTRVRYITAHLSVVRAH